MSWSPSAATFATATDACNGLPLVANDLWRWGVVQEEIEEAAVVREVFGLVSNRSDNVCNFLEGGR